MDVDGTLTDGKIFMGSSGELFKMFDIKDGYGIKKIIPEHQIIPVVITARNSRILEHRFRELDVVELHQGVLNKLDKLKEIIAKYSEIDNYEYSFKNVIYIGDDIMDVQCMQSVKENGGLAACPRDAIKKVLEISDFICTKRAGEGAVRELIDWLIYLRTSLEESLNFVRSISNEAFDFILGFNPSIQLDGKYDLSNGVLANVITYLTRNLEVTCYESHKKYIDVQYLIYGTEIMMIHPVNELKNIYEEYSFDRDITLYDYRQGNVTVLCPGDAIVLFPDDAHRGAISLNYPLLVRKIVIKIPMKS